MRIKEHNSKGKPAAVATIATMLGCTEFLMGWLRRFGEPAIFFVPLEQKRAPNL
jgi:hypothetical protein